MKFDIQHKKSHLVFLILLAGDIATNPGPTMATQSGHLPDIQSTREKVDGKFLTKCLAVNARSLLSVHKKDGKQTCHLSNFQDLVYSEEADLVWVTETWLRDDIELKVLKFFRGATLFTEKTVNLALVEFYSLLSRALFQHLAKSILTPI